MNTFSKYSSMFWYGLLFLGLVVVILIEGQFFFGKSNSLSSTASELSTRIELLQSRNAALSSISPEVIAASKQIATVLPAENSVLLISSQLRNTAILNKVTLKNLSTNSIPDLNDPLAGSTQVGVIVEGDTPSVLQFLANLTTLAPLVEINTVNFITNPTTTIAQLSLASFWSPFPSQLPSITEPVVALTPEETELMQRVSAFTTPIVSDTFEDSTTSALTVNSAPFAPVR